MITRIDAGKVVGGNIGMGRLAPRRALGVALGAVIGIALLASVAVSQHYSTRSAPTVSSQVGVTGGQQRQLAWLDARDAAPAPAIPTLPGGQQRQLARIEQRDGGLAVTQPAGPPLQERLHQDDVRDNGPAVTLGGDRSSLPGPAWFDARDYAPVTPSLTGIGRQQARLYQIELRDNGEGTTGDDSGPCLPLRQPCNR